MEVPGHGLTIHDAATVLKLSTVWIVAGLETSGSPMYGALSSNMDKKMYM